MKVTLLITMSLNGIIARDNHAEDFISDNAWDIFVKETNRVGCIIWGRQTFETFNTWEKEDKDSIKNVTKIIVSNNDLELSESFYKVNSPKEAIELAQKQGFSEVLLGGGSKLNASFAKENLIDEVIINFESVIIANGIPVFNKKDYDMKLRLIKSQTLNNSIIQVKYEVIK